jgi:hypothetical protein
MMDKSQHTPTLIAIAAIAYVAAVGLHEHLGHATACVLLGSRPIELGAFYVNCDDSRLSSAAVRIVALAGPLVSLLTGIVCLLLLPRMPREASRGFYFLWLLGSIALMGAAGYPLFSGISGLGDLGTGADGALRGAQPEWLWRIALTALGGVSYLGVVALSVRLIAPRLEGDAEARVRQGSRLNLIAYLTGAVVYLLIGLLNPLGLVILLESVLPSSLGGTSGLLWMMQRLDRRKPPTGPALSISRSLGWILAAGAITIAYALILGPTLRP